MKPSAGKLKRRIIDDASHADFITFSVDRCRRLVDHEHAKRIAVGLTHKATEAGKILSLCEGTQRGLSGVLVKAWRDVDNVVPVC